MPEHSPSPKRRGCLVRFGAAFAALSAVAGSVIVQYVTGGAGGPGCRVVSGDGRGTTYEFTPEQAVNAATIAAVGTNRELPERAVTIALATAIQESGLRNLAHGDRDSLGLFQQRPSQGWGTEQQVTDPTYAADIFYKHLEKVPDYLGLPLTVAAQRVQRSGYPEAYAKHEKDAEVLSAALTGSSAATLTCEGRADTPAVGTGPQGVRTALERDFGRDVKTGTESSGASGTSAETSGGRVVTIPVDKDTAGAGRTEAERGWQLAHWAVANASALRIESVSYAGRQWTAGNTDSKWRATGSSNTEAAGAGGVSSDSGTGSVRIVTAP